MYPGVILGFRQTDVQKVVFNTIVYPGVHLEVRQTDREWGSLHYDLYSNFNNQEPFINNLYGFFINNSPLFLVLKSSFVDEPLDSWVLFGDKIKLPCSPPSGILLLRDG